MSGIELSQMIVDLRRELQQAQQLGAAEDLKFRVGDIDIELQVTTTKEAGAKTGVKFWVCEAGAEGKMASQAIHKLRLKLTPIVGKGKGELEIASDSGRPTD